MAPYSNTLSLIMRDIRFSDSNVSYSFTQQSCVPHPCQDPQILRSSLKFATMMIFDLSTSYRLISYLNIKLTRADIAEILYKAALTKIIDLMLKLQASCKDCPEGYYCDGTIQNDTVCNHGVQNPSPCEPGSFCLPGTKFAKEHRCPNGTYNDILYLKKIDECTPCPSGQYCGQEGLSSPSGFCDGGFYCLSGASVAAPIDGVTGNICPKGAYCPVGSNASTLCPPGTYNPVEGRIILSIWLRGDSLGSYISA